MGIKEIHELNIHISRAFFMKFLSVMLNDDIMNYKSPIHFFYLVRKFQLLVRSISHDISRGCYLFWCGETSISGR